MGHIGQGITPTKAKLEALVRTNDEEEKEMYEDDVQHHRGSRATIGGTLSNRSIRPFHDWSGNQEVENPRWAWENNLAKDRELEEGSHKQVARDRYDESEIGKWVYISQASNIINE